MFFREYHPTRDLQEFIKSIIETKSKAEEDRIIKYTLLELKKKIASRRPSDAKKAEYAIKSLYAEMLGHEARFGYDFLVKMVESKSLLVKRLGYLTCSLTLHNAPDLKMMMVQSLLKDISGHQRKNLNEILAGLNALTKLLCPTFASAFESKLKELTQSQNPFIRKKALIALQRVQQLSPMEGFSSVLKRLLSDQSPSVIATCLNIVEQEAKKDAKEYVVLLKPLCFLLQQIFEKKAAYYDYQKIPEPFMQIKILEIFRVLVQGDRQCSLELYPILEKTLMRADSVNTDMSFSVVYEAILTICSLYPNKILLQQASKAVTKFLSAYSNNTNLTYMGVKALRHIALKDASLIGEHQVFVIRCLESNDDSMKRITLELLYKNTNSSNINVIANKLLTTLAASNDLSFKQSLTDKVFDLAVRFSASSRWFLKVSGLLVKHASECFSQSMINTLLPIFQEFCDEEPDFAGEIARTFAEMLEVGGGQPSDTLIRLFAWVVSNLSVPRLREVLPSGFIGRVEGGVEAEVDECEVELRDRKGTKTSSGSGLLPQRDSNLLEDFATPKTQNARVGGGNDVEVDLLGLDFGVSDSTAARVQNNTASNTHTNNDLDLLGGDFDLLGGVGNSNPVTQPGVQNSNLNDLDLFGDDLLGDETAVAETSNTAGQVGNTQDVDDFGDLLGGGPTGSSGPIDISPVSKEAEELNAFISRICGLTMGLFEWNYKSDLTKCWVLEALTTLRKLLQQYQGFHPFISAFDQQLERDSDHPHFEVRLQVRQVLEFQISNPGPVEADRDYDPGLEFLFTFVQQGAGEDYDETVSEEINGVREQKRDAVQLNFKRYELMTKKQGQQIDIDLNRPVKSKGSRPDPLAEEETPQKVEIESEDIILDDAQANPWTLQGYQTTGEDSKNPNIRGQANFKKPGAVSNVVISEAEKKANRNMFKEFNLVGGKSRKSASKHNASQKESTRKTQANSKPAPPPGQSLAGQDIEIDYEGRKRLRKEQEQRKLAQDIFSGMTAHNSKRSRQNSKASVQTNISRAKPLTSIYGVRPKQITLGEYEDQWEEMEERAEKTKEVGTLVTAEWLRGVIVNGLRMSVVSEEGSDLIAAGQEHAKSVFLYLTFDAEDNTVEYIVASASKVLTEKVRRRLETLAK